MTENELMDKVVDLAHTLGWKAAHFRPARTEQGWRTACQYDAKGYPDLHLTYVADFGTPRFRFDELYAELKTWRNRTKVDVDQARWLHDLSKLGHDVFVWTERDFDNVIAPRLMRPTNARVA